VLTVKGIYARQKGRGRRCRRRQQACLVSSAAAPARGHASAARAVRPACLPSAEKSEMYI